MVYVWVQMFGVILLHMLRVHHLRRETDASSESSALRLLSLHPWILCRLFLQELVYCDCCVAVPLKRVALCLDVK